MADMAVVEDQVTVALVQVVTAMSPEDRMAFLKDVFGIAVVSSDGPVDVEAHPAVPYASEGERIVLVGLAPSGRVEWPEAAKTSPGSVVDLVLSQLGRLTVIVEVKIRGALDGWQLQRHAGAWDMPVPAGRWEDVPRGVVIVDWNGIRAWLRAAVPELPLVQELLERLRALGLTTAAPALSVRARTVAVRRGEEPAVAPLDEILTGVRPAEVRAVVGRLYGPQGSAHVSQMATDTKRDGRAVASRFEAAGERVPPKLSDTGPGGHGDVITPARALSMFATAKALARRNLIQPSWADVRDRLLFRGADRSLAVAMWAFADALTGPDHRRLRAHAGRLWTVAPPRSHATPELVEALDELGISLI
jgi:hypothetical protein